MSSHTHRIEALLYQRAQLEKELESLKTSFCIMRCDMCDSQAYYDTFGDVAGLQLAKHFFDVTTPIIESSGERNIRTIGDEILVHFDETREAFKASLLILSALARFNESRTPAHSIHVTITLHFGNGFVFGDIYGGAVNVAARIAALNSEPDTIVVSQQFLDNCSDEERAKFEFHCNVTVRGKSDTLTLYKYVVQQETEDVASFRAVSPVRMRLVEIRGVTLAKDADRLLRDLLADIRRPKPDVLVGEPLPPSVFISQILEELAKVAVTRELRSKYWSEAFQETRIGWDKDHDAAIADSAADIAVDCFQDELNPMADDARTFQLREAGRLLDEALAMQLSPREKAHLLARKSSLVRHLAATEISPSGKRKRQEKAQRIISIAMKESSDPPILLEAAATQWALASTERTDYQYAERLRVTEHILRSPFLQYFEVGQLALARFYRLTYRPLECCECFPKRSMNVRRLFRNTFLYAEAAYQLARSQYPTDIVQQHVEEAISFAEQAVAAGVSDARTLVALAFLRAVAEPQGTAAVALAELYAGEQSLSWSDVLEWISTIKEEDLASGAFILGIENSGVLSRLATFCRSVLANPELAEALARVAVRMGPQNAVALTNLARSLAESDNRGRLLEAERIIEKVPNFADRRFRWWRAVRKNIRAKLYTDLPTRPAKERRLADRNTVFTEFDQLSERLDAILTVDRSNRPLQFGYIVKGLVQLTAGTALVGDHLEETGGMEVKFLGQTLRLIPIWRDGMVTLGDLKFPPSPDQTTVVISVSEFAPEVAAWRAEGGKHIVIIDRQDCEGAIKEQVNFDEALSRSLAHHCSLASGRRTA